MLLYLAPQNWSTTVQPQNKRIMNTSTALVQCTVFHLSFMGFSSARTVLVLLLFMKISCQPFPSCPSHLNPSRALSTAAVVGEQFSCCSICTMCLLPSFLVLVLENLLLGLNFPTFCRQQVLGLAGTITDQWTWQEQSQTYAPGTNWWSWQKLSQTDWTWRELWRYKNFTMNLSCHCPLEYNSFLRPNRVCLAFLVFYVFVHLFYFIFIC